jgi:hypothetical protein
MLEKFNSVTRAVSLSQSVLVAISAKQGKVITTELLDGMTQKAVSAAIDSHANTLLSE